MTMKASSPAAGNKGNPLAIHPFAQLFPELPPAELKDLAADIRLQGLIEPIVLYQDKILDGRNRYQAAQLTGYELKPQNFDTFAGSEEEALQYVVSKNLIRRHMSATQRAAVAAEMANLPVGRPPLTANSADLHNKTSRAKAAKTMHVSKRAVDQAAKVQAHGTPELKQAIKEGSIAVDTAAALAELPRTEQQQVLKTVRTKKTGEASRNTRTELKKILRAKREKALGAKQKALPKQQFGVIYADPPWAFRVFSSKGKDRAAENHYPVMEFRKLAKLPVLKLAARDATLFLWATAPMLPQAMQLISAWGFAYKSHLVWAKPGFGTGYWFRSSHELLLVATRGNPPAPAPGRQAPSILKAPAARHSAKPPQARAIIERYFPSLPKVELFARGAAPKGWTHWGQEAK